MLTRYRAALGTRQLLDVQYMHVVGRAAAVSGRRYCTAVVTTPSQPLLHTTLQLGFIRPPAQTTTVQLSLYLRLDHVTL